MRSRLLTVDENIQPSPILILGDVTLIAATSVAIPPTILAMATSLAQVTFAKAIFFCDRPPPSGTLPVIEWIKIEPLRSRLDYSHFILHRLWEHIATSHVLCVQWDGYVIDSSRWDPAFLNYDYIGAPWPHFGDDHTVGNGGFSLRSRRLLEACHALGIEETPEDVAICRTHRATLEHDFGIRFAPESLARRFAFERQAPTKQEFGFHGAFNLVNLIDKKRFFSILKGLEPGILNRREHKELFWSALRRGRFSIAHVVISRMFRKGSRRH